MKPLKMGLLGLMALLLLTAIIVISLNLLQFSQLMKADSHAHFVELIEQENLGDKVVSVLYDDLKADYCTLKADQQSWVYKYTLNDDFVQKISKIEQLFATQPSQSSDPLAK